MKIVQLTLALVLTMTVNGFAGGKNLHILDKINPAWQRLDTLTGSYLTEGQQQTVQELAFAAAAGDICDGLNVDHDKFVAAFQIFDDEKLKAMSPEEQQLRKQKLLVVYGIATGLFAAEGMLVEDKFCAAAEELRAKSPDHFWEKNQKK